MSNSSLIRGAGLVALALALLSSGSDSGSFQALAATAPLSAAPNAVVAPPPAAPPALAPAARPAAAPAPAAPALAAPPPTAAAAAAAAGGPPAPRIIVIDRTYILQRSSAGQDMMAQAQNLSKAAETQFKTEETALATEAGQLQQQLAIMAPDVRDQKEKDFTAKQQAFQGRVATRQAEIQAGFNKAARQVEVALEPILKALMVERGANMVLDRSSVILSSVDIDVTPIAVQRLDKSLPHVKVDLTPVPAATAAAGAAPRPAGAPALAPAAPPAAGRK
jgi:Skp family chaperone for outer membrane proteins